MMHHAPEFWILYLAWTVGILALLYVLIAYVVLPALWSHYKHQPGLATVPMVTRTKQGIPGDPLNVGLIGSKEEIIRAMSAAGGDRCRPSPSFHSRVCENPARFCPGSLKNREVVDEEAIFA